MVRDITERKAQKAEIDRITRLYCVLSQVNHAIVRAQSGEKLCESVCRIATEFGHFVVSWIGMRDPVSRDLALFSGHARNGGFPVSVAWNQCKIARVAVEQDRPYICNAVESAKSETECDSAALSTQRSVPVPPFRYHSGGLVCGVSACSLRNPKLSTRMK